MLEPSTSRWSRTERACRRRGPPPERTGVTVPASPASPAPPIALPQLSGRRTTSATAVAVDLGSRTVGVWAAHHGTVDSPWADAPSTAGTLVRRGRIVDVEGCTRALSHLVRRYPQPVPAGSVVVACRPLLA